MIKKKGERRALKSLEWFDLMMAFYPFKREAEKHGFYMEELEGMEKSLMEMRPFPEDKKMEKAIESLKENR